MAEKIKSRLSFLFLNSGVDGSPLLFKVPAEPVIDP